MTPATRSIHRTALFSLLALHGALFAARDASASESWHYTVVDGPGSGGHGNSGNSTTAGVRGASAAVYVPPFGVEPMYARKTSAGRALYTGLDVDFKGSTCNGEDGYSLVVLDDTHNSATIDLMGPNALQDGYNTWIGYVDNNGDLYAGVSAGAGEGSMIFYSDLSGGGTERADGEPSMALMGAGTYNGFIFYQADYIGSSTEIHYQYYTESTSSWSGDSSSTILDGPAVGGNSCTSPTSATFNGALWAFYYDTADECLKGKTSGTTNGKLGSDWTAEAAPGGDQDCIDGYGGTQGQNYDILGEHAVAYVDTNASPNRLYVFYSDTTAGSLRASYLDASSGATWHAEVVDSSITLSDPPGQGGLPVIAPVWNGANQVYYIDSTNHRVRATQRGSSGWITPSTIDGSGCTESGCTHDDLDGPISIVVSPECSTDSGDGPHLFYADNQTGALREAFWE